MSRVRLALFAVSAAGLTLLLVWGTAGLPDFGHYGGPYGDILARLAKPQRQIANTVTGTVFDYRAFDTLGEELILLAAASATALLLREVREGSVEGIVDPVRSEAVRGAGAIAAVVAFLLGLEVVAHGYLTPGGGFQGGVVLSAAFALVFLTLEYRAFQELTASKFAEPAEAVGAAAFVGFGLLALALGVAFLQNFLPHGAFGRLLSSGSVPLVNWSAGIAVTGAFLVLYGEYLQEAMAARHGRDT